MIPPTPGRVVWYHPPINEARAGFSPPALPGVPLAALVARVWSDTCVNLMVIDANGMPHSRTSVLLVQDGMTKPDGDFAEWMPYQKGQAAKLDATAVKDMDAERARIDRIARVCHEANRAYCQALGDDSQPAWEDAPAWQRESARMGVDLHLSGDFGPEASHISWAKQKMDDGWVYGPVKDPAAKTHPCLLPFNQLPREQQAKDFIFRGVVHALR